MLYEVITVAVIRTDDEVAHVIRNVGHLLSAGEIGKHQDRINAVVLYCQFLSPLRI